MRQGYVSGYVPRPEQNEHQTTRLVFDISFNPDSCAYTSSILREYTCIERRHTRMGFHTCTPPRIGSVPDHQSQIGALNLSGGREALFFWRMLPAVRCKEDGSAGK